MTRNDARFYLQSFLGPIFSYYNMILLVWVESRREDVQSGEVLDHGQLRPVNQSSVSIVSIADH